MMGDPVALTSVRLYSLADVQELSFKNFTDHRGSLVPIEEGKDIPMDVRRLFYIRPSAAGETRGQHGHFRCSQLLICLNGSVTVVVQDGLERKNYRLDRHDRGLLIPPTLWAEEIYETANTILLVLCDRLFEAEDYISDFEEFLSLRAAGTGRPL